LLILVKETIKMAFNPIVDEEKCVGCEECVDVCPVEVFEMEDEKSVPVNAEECMGCESCVEVCEEDAIVIEED
jgi:NAD-dependent dihydropyrimidine dehydrogenase PreA subunit